MILAQITLGIVWAWAAATFLRAIYQRVSGHVIYDEDAHAIFMVHVAGALALSSGLFAVILR